MTILISTFIYRHTVGQYVHKIAIQRIIAPSLPDSIDHLASWPLDHRWLCNHHLNLQSPNKRCTAQKPKIIPDLHQLQNKLCTEYTKYTDFTHQPAFHYHTTSTNQRLCCLLQKFHCLMELFLSFHWLCLCQRFSLQYNHHLL